MYKVITEAEEYTNPTAETCTAVFEQQCGSFNNDPFELTNDLTRLAVLRKDP